MTQDADSAPVERKAPLYRDRRVVAAVFAVLILALGAAGYVLFLAKPQKLDVWKPATVPYAESCATPGQCQIFRRTGPDGGNAAPGQTPPALVYNPKVDDAVAQWSDCLQSIMTCVRAKPRGQKAGVDACVAASVCPQPCKDRYQSASGGDFTSAQSAVFGVFVEQDAVCRPAG